MPSRPPGTWSRSAAARAVAAASRRVARVTRTVAQPTRSRYSASSPSWAAARPPRVTSARQLRAVTGSAARPSSASRWKVATVLAGARRLNRQAASQGLSCSSANGPPSTITGAAPISGDPHWRQQGAPPAHAGEQLGGCLQVLDEAGQHRLGILAACQDLAQGLGGEFLLAEGWPVQES